MIQLRIIFLNKYFLKTIFPFYTGESPDCDNCTFPVCPGPDSCTKQTKYAVHPWLGSGPEFTIGEKKPAFDFWKYSTLLHFLS